MIGAVLPSEALLLVAALRNTKEIPWEIEAVVLDALNILNLLDEWGCLWIHKRTPFKLLPHLSLKKIAVLVTYINYISDQKFTNEIQLSKLSKFSTNCLEGKKAISREALFYRGH